MDREFWLVSMTTLNIASKANQATTVPALLVAQYAKEADSNASININFEEIEDLKGGHKATVELAIGDAGSSYGSENVIEKLLGAYPILQTKNVDLVCAQNSTEAFTTLLTYKRSKSG